MPTNRKRDLGSKKLSRKAADRDFRTFARNIHALPGTIFYSLMMGTVIHCGTNHFTPEWEKSWEKQAGAEGALNHYSEFKKRDGFAQLKALNDKGAAPNFILGLFIPYLWNNSIPQEEHKEPDAIRLTEFKNALDQTREFYEIMKRRNFYDRMIGKPPKMDTQGFENVFSFLEKAIQENLGIKDFSKARRGSPRDKENRVIFALYEYIKQATGSPQWATFFDLLLSAGAITTGKKKRKKGHENDSESQGPDSHIRTRIKSFETNHPRESQAIKEVITPLIFRVISFLQSN